MVSEGLRRSALGCHGYAECSATERSRIVFLGWFILWPSLLVQSALGVAVNSAFSKQYWSTFATGTATFFSTAPLPAFVLLYFVLQ